MRVPVRRSGSAMQKALSILAVTRRQCTHIGSVAQRASLSKHGIEDSKLDTKGLLELKTRIFFNFSFEIFRAFYPLASSRCCCIHDTHGIHY